jgi:hypothetical protein
MFALRNPKRNLQVHMTRLNLPLKRKRMPKRNPRNLDLGRGQRKVMTKILSLDLPKRNVKVAFQLMIDVALFVYTKDVKPLRQPIVWIVVHSVQAVIAADILFTTQMVHMLVSRCRFVDCVKNKVILKIVVEEIGAKLAEMTGWVIVL